jgi:hypothetical protein
MFILAGAERLTALEVDISHLRDLCDSAVSARLQRSRRVLRRLTIRRFQSDISDDAFTHAGECAALQSAEISGFNLTSRSLETLSASPSLSALEMSSCWRLDHGALAHLERCRLLTKHFGLSVNWRRSPCRAGASACIARVAHGCLRPADHPRRQRC